MQTKALYDTIGTLQSVQGNPGRVNKKMEMSLSLMLCK